jgi:glycosyltransferase involved in cell wall biosynthesis
VKLELQGRDVSPATGKSADASQKQHATPATRLPGISAVIPCYNSAASLSLLVERVSSVFTEAFEAFEVILVDDGSSDGTWLEINRLASQYPFVAGYRMMRNYGQHNAILCGIRAASQGLIVTMDDDLQNPPEEVPRLVAKLNEGHDVVYGKPEVEQHGLLRDLASVLTKTALKNVMGAETARDVSAFRILRTPLRNAFSRYQAPYVSVDVLLTWATNRFAAVRVKHDPRRSGQSNYTFLRLLNIALTLMTGFTILPLRVASIVGFVFTGFGFALLAYILARYFISGISVAGFTFLASTITLLSGVQLFALGIIGEYLARIHLRMMDRPTYVIAESTSDGFGLQEKTSGDFSQSAGRS